MSKMKYSALIAAIVMHYATNAAFADGIDKLAFQNLTVGAYAPANVRYKQSFKWLDTDKPKIPAVSLDASIGNLFFPDFSNAELARASDKALNPFFSLNSTLFGSSVIEVIYKPAQSVKAQYTYYWIEWVPPWATLFIPYAIGYSFSAGGTYSKQTYTRSFEALTIDSKALDGTARIHLGSMPVILVIDIFLGINVAYGTSSLTASNTARDPINRTYSTGIIGFHSQVANTLLLGMNFGLNFNELVPVFSLSLAAEF